MDPSHRLDFRVEGMCCAEEVAALKKAVAPVVGAEDLLRFHLLTGKMTVLGGEAEPSAIVQAVRSAGLDASLWTDSQPAPAGFWDRRGHAVLCWVSGGSALVGLFLEARFGGGLLNPAAGGDDPSRAVPTIAVPTIAVVAYLIAITAGMLRVVPKAWQAARSLRPDMNLLMTIAVLGAIGIGEWFEAASVAFLFALALLLEGWSVGRARRAIESLLDLAPETARVRDLESGQVIEERIEDVPIGALVLVRPGDRVPLDGEVVAGSTSIDQSPITGESMPVLKAIGDEVFAGTVNVDGAFEMTSTRAASQTTLARIVSLVEDAQANRAPSERWVERFARRYTPSVLVLALAVAILPPLIFGQEWSPWFYNALVLLVIACPCALVISTPVSIVAGLAAAARAGVLIKGGAFLEAPAGWKVVAFDKTGTLTLGRPRVQRIVPLDAHSENELLGLAAALESESTHPLARAIVEAAEERSVPFEAAPESTLLPGKGSEGLIDNRRYWIGSHRLLIERVAGSERNHQRALSLAAELEGSGQTVVAVGSDTHVCGLLTLKDEIRDSARPALEALRVSGIGRIVVLTGDNRQAAASIGEALGVDDVRAELLPEDKLKAVRALRAEHGEVAMVGDGVNDAPAMAASSCGIAMGAAGTDVALETADIALMSDDLGRLPWLVGHSRRTLAVVRQNIGFALGVKVVFLGLTLAGAATLWMAIAADMGASLLVIFNGLRLLRIEGP
jgi:Cd2+/Zn2+-exporting ATPase